MDTLFYKTKKKVISFFADIKVYPYPNFIILYGNTNYKISGPHMRKILDNIQPGDVLLRTYYNYLGSFFIPGYWSHAAHFEGPNNIIHMLGDGICEEDILTFMKCDDVCLLRSKQGIKNIHIAIKEARKNLNDKIDYDYNFSNDPSKFYCTELICNIHNYPKEDNIVMPDELYYSDFFEIIVPGEFSNKSKQRKLERNIKRK